MGEPTKRLYLDLDGVMADFDAHFPAVFNLDHRSMADDAMWERINAHPSYFRDMLPCPGAIEFFRSIEHLRPIILTACPKSNYPHVAAQKRAWVREHLSEHVTVLPVLGGRHKPLFMQEPGDVLIDDWPKNAEAWAAAGGIPILHRSFEETAAAVAEHFPDGATRYDDLPPGCAPAGSLHAYERAYNARYKPGEERAHLHGHLAGLRAVVLLDRQERAGISVDVVPMKTSAGADYYVRVKCSGRDCTPYMFKERWKAEYEAAHFSWLFGLRDAKPELMAYGPESHPDTPALVRPEWHRAMFPDDSAPAAPEERGVPR